jgi:hypothetical protein
MDDADADAEDAETNVDEDSVWVVDNAGDFQRSVSDPV